MVSLRDDFIIFFAILYVEIAGEVGLAAVFDEPFDPAGDAALAFAVATIYMVIPLLTFLYSEDYIIEGVAYSGGVKG